jgi:hypothetical protein
MMMTKEHEDWGKHGPPADEWTDEEWLAVLKTIPPDAHFSVGEMAVAEMRRKDD